jgi:hypothetical protein
MQPNQTRWHVEYWFPTDKEMDIRKMNSPTPILRPVIQIPLFGWARKSEVLPWINLVEAMKKKSKPFGPPAVDQNNWPPSGIENLDEPFKMAINNSTGTNKESWKFYYGTWLAGRGNSDEAIKILSQTNIGISKALLARLLKLQGDLAGSKQAYEAIKENWLQIHPQVVIERDKVLRALGPSYLKEREAWLAKVAALKDEWVIERRVQLLIDKGDYAKAKDLLLSTTFQKVHQTYTRTGLWIQISEKLNIPFEPIPPQLGEDRLARFGAYREFE